jgi:hypothetical protein
MRPLAACQISQGADRSSSGKHRAKTMAVSSVCLALAQMPMVCASVATTEYSLLDLLQCDTSALFRWI